MMIFPSARAGRGTISIAARKGAKAIRSMTIASLSFYNNLVFRKMPISRPYGIKMAIF
jgi:hypothetical protein